MSEKMQNIPEEILILLMRKWEGELSPSDASVLESYLAKNPAVAEQWLSQSFLRNELDDLSKQLKPKKLSDIKKAQILQLTKTKKSEWKYWVFYGVAASLFFSMVGGFYYVANEKSKTYHNELTLNSKSSIDEEDNKEGLLKESSSKDNFGKPAGDDKNIDNVSKQKERLKLASEQSEDSPKPTFHDVSDEILKKKSSEVTLDGAANKSAQAKSKAQEVSAVDEKSSLASKDFSDAVIKPTTKPTKISADDQIGNAPSNFEAKAKDIFRSAALGETALQKFSSKEWGFEKFKELAGLPEVDQIDRVVLAKGSTKVAEKENEEDGSKKTEKMKQAERVEEPEENADVIKEKAEKAVVANEIVKEEKKDLGRSSKKSKLKLPPAEHTIESKSVAPSSEDISRDLDEVYQQLQLLNSYQGIEEQVISKQNLLKKLKENKFFQHDQAFQQYLDQYK